MKHPIPTHAKQLASVFAVMKSGSWRTLEYISRAAHEHYGTRTPEASASARLRDIRNKLRMKVDKRRVVDGKGLFEYRMRAT